MRKPVICQLALVSLFFSAPLSAETFRCNGHIIEEGMTQDEVLQHCGSPDETSNQTRISWTYKKHQGRMDVIVYFYANGKVEIIDSVHD